MIERDAYDEMGVRWAKCTRCGMGWIENREPVELFPGEWTTAGERAHTCPDPMPDDQARVLTDAAHAAGGIIVDQRTKAAIRLGLENGGGDAR